MKTRAVDTSAEFAIDPAEPVYVIGVVSHLVKIPIWTLRLLDREGLVRPRRRTGRARLYSMRDMRLLIRIRELCIERKVNLHGVRLILRLETAGQHST